MIMRTKLCVQHFATSKNFSFKEFYLFSEKSFCKSNRKLFSCVCIAWYKHSRGWENSWQLRKPLTSSRVYIPVLNLSHFYIRLCKHKKRFLLLKWHLSFLSVLMKTVVNQWMLDFCHLIYSRYWRPGWVTFNLGGIQKFSMQHPLKKMMTPEKRQVQCGKQNVTAWPFQPYSLSLLGKDLW